MASTPPIEWIHQNKAKAKCGKKYQLHKDAIANTSGHLSGHTTSAKNCKVVELDTASNTEVPRTLGLADSSAHLPVTHSKVIFTSSFVTIFPVGNWGEGGVILKSLIFRVLTPFTVSLLPARAMVTGISSGLVTP